MPANMSAVLRKHGVWLTAIAVLLVIVVVVVLVRLLGRSPNVKAVNRDIGAGVLVTGPRVPRDTKATVIRDASVPFKLVGALGPVFRVTPSGRLPASMTVKIPLDRPVADPGAVLLARADQSREVWTVVKPTLTADRRHIEVNVDHLSLFQPLQVQVSEAVAAFERELARDVDDITGDPMPSAQRPACPNGDAAVSDGYSVTAVGRGAFSWCFGVENGTRVLRVVNHRRYPLELEYSRLSLLNVSKAGLGVAGRANARADGRLVLFPIGHASFAVNLPLSGGQAVLNADVSGLSEGLYALEAGVATVVNVLSRFNVAPAIPTGKAMSRGQYEEIVDYMGAFLRHQPCAEAVRRHSGEDVQGIVDACMSPARVEQVFGWKGMLLAPALTARTPERLFHREVAAIEGEAKGKGLQRILIDRESPLRQLAGQWRLAQGGTLDIRPNGRGTVSWSVGPCGGGSPSPGGASPSPETGSASPGTASPTWSPATTCTLTGALAFTNVPGGLTGRYTAVTYRQADGATPPAGFSPPAEAPVKGDPTGEIKFVADGVATNTEFGNPYLCRRDAPATWRIKCGR